MEGNVCNFNYLDEDFRPPPRKRLLAGYKKQNSNDQLSRSPSSYPTTPTEVNMPFRNLLSSHSCSSTSSSFEELAESSKKAALAASKTAEAARAAAEEKAVVAARAIATAKRALELMAAFSEETSGRDRHTKRNKSKKQVMVHSLYKKHDEVDIGKTDEMGTKLLLQVNCSSSRLYSSDSKSLGHKKLKSSPVIWNSKLPNEGILKEGNPHAMCNGKAALDTESPYSEVATLDSGKGSQCLTKLISCDWRMEKEIVTQKRKARKQLIRMIERHVDLN